MKKIIFVIACCLFFAPFSYAKRQAPKEVTPVRIQEIEYRAPHEKMGYVEAWNIKTGGKLWERKIYPVFIYPLMETDVQWIFITDLKAVNDQLIVTNELNKKYALDLKTKKVTRLFEGTEILSPNLVIEQVIRKAKDYSIEQGLYFEGKEFFIDSVNYDWKTKKWNVFFQGKEPAPGNHFSIYIDDKTEKIELMLGK